jgi:hypothetical protein
VKRAQLGRLVTRAIREIKVIKAPQARLVPRELRGLKVTRVPQELRATRVPQVRPEPLDLQGRLGLRGQLAPRVLVAVVAALESSH